ncbi:phosphatase PAP2 family protein [Streptomyces jeddahensis]|uniref:Uncharacterized protein n=1 Tax=Streptomyces jeddahensis TaxID=1716141 RepID=A0A177HEU8_9ACTN|nr:hypothetical protein [Streptomyces jeddahensis]OAH09485.1 hypothetical protein STSP_71990 [Streptomyces jeddahensis]
MTRILGTSHLDLNLSSEATGTTRHYDDAGRLNEDMIDARVWAGIHFHSADIDGCQAGDRIGVWTLTHYFQPVQRRRHSNPATPAATAPAAVAMRAGT